MLLCLGQAMYGDWVREKIKCYKHANVGLVIEFGHMLPCRRGQT